MTNRSRYDELLHASPGDFFCLVTGGGVTRFDYPSRPETPTSAGIEPAGTNEILTPAHELNRIVGRGVWLTVINKLTVAVAVTILAIVGAVEGQAPSENQVRIERAQAEREVPRLAEVLQLKPGMTVADVGAGGGAITVVLGKWIGSGRVFATDIGAPQLQLIRDYVMREGLTNVTVIEGGASSTNLPDACCDAIFLRDVYHHLSDPESMNKSLRASLKPGGRLAVLDFAPEPGSKTPAGVPANREGHGIGASIVISEMSAAGLTHSNTIEKWPPGGDPKSPIFLLLFRKP